MNEINKTASFEALKLCGSTVLFRTFPDTFDVSDGLTPKNPSANIPLCDFHRLGSNNDIPEGNSQYVATSKSLENTVKWAKQSGNTRIAVIDAKKLVGRIQAEDVFDSSTEDKCYRWYRQQPSAKKNVKAYPGSRQWHKITASFAAASQEVDFTATIPADCFFIVTMDEYAAAYRKIWKNNEFMNPYDFKYAVVDELAAMKQYVLG